MEIFIEFIQTCGFPIFCCVYLMIQQSKQDEFNRKQQEEMRKSIDRNTDAMNELRDYIRGDTN